MAKWIKSVIAQTIKTYQRFLSPDHGYIKAVFPYGVCKYHPTCSQYMSQAVSKYGWKGVYMGVLRVARCHPFVRGGFDPVK